MSHPTWCTCAECMPDPAERAAKVVEQDLREMDAVFEPGATSRSGGTVTTRVGGKRVTIRVESEDE